MPNAKRPYKIKTFFSDKSKHRIHVVMILEEDGSYHIDHDHGKVTSFIDYADAVTYIAQRTPECSKRKS